MICALSESNPYSILQEMSTVNTNPSTYKIRGHSLLQTLDEENGNRRIYSHAIGEIYVNSANEKIKNGRLLGEMDHPFIRNPKDPSEVKRQLMVMLKECSHKFNKMWIEGNRICALVETLSNDHGIDMARMAALDGIPIGFSCRAIGKVKQKQLHGKPILEVTQPTVFVTYDSVSDPSHKSAELKDISEIVTGTGGVEKICQSMVSENTGDQVLIDESNQLFELRQIFANSDDSHYEPVSFLLENFLNNKFLDNRDSKTRQNFIENNMTNLLSEYLSSSDSIYGISNYSTLNESNVHDLMKDYSHNHSNSYYHQTSFMRDLINSYIG